MSLLTALGGFILEWFVWTQDWVNIMTFTKTPAGIEDIILGFSAGGFIAIVFKQIFNRRLVTIGPDTKTKIVFRILFVFFISFTTGITLLWWNVHSFYSSIVPMAITTVAVLVQRRDLLASSVLSGLMAVSISIPWYLLIFYSSPQFPQAYWRWEYLSGITFLQIPIEDLIFWLVTGMFIAPLYEFWYNYRLEKLP